MAGKNKASIGTGTKAIEKQKITIKSFSHDTFTWMKEDPKKYEEKKVACLL